MNYEEKVEKLLQDLLKQSEDKGTSSAIHFGEVKLWPSRPLVVLPAAR